MTRGGRRTGLGFGDGSYQAYYWEIDGDLTAIGHAYPGRPADNVTFSYAHDRVGRVTAEQIGHAAYDYEAQIASVTYGAASAINTYPTVGSTSFQYTDTASINPDGLHSDGAIHFASPWRYRYNARGALTNASSGGAQTRYHFDALGERFWIYHYDTSTGPQTSYYSFSDGLRPETIQEPTYSRPSNTGAWTSTGTRTYVLGPLPDERLIYRASDGQIYYPHTDRRGSTVALSQGASGQGMAVQTYAYDEFGQSGPSGSSGYPFRYTGQRLDPWTGIYHYKARDYSPNLGRFLQPDPALFVDGPNLYAYVGNNPWNATDPTGLYQCRPAPCSAAINTAISNIALAAANAETEEAANRLNQLVEFFGAEGEDTGVFIETAIFIDGRLGDANTAADGAVTIRIDQSVHDMAQELPMIPNYSRTVAGILGHEGRHGIDSRGLGNRNPANLTEARALEQGAYADQFRVEIGMRRSGIGATLGPGTPASEADATSFQEAVDQATAVSIALWCASPGAVC